CSLSRSSTGWKAAGHSPSAAEAASLVSIARICFTSRTRGSSGALSGARDDIGVETDCATDGAGRDGAGRSIGGNWAGTASVMPTGRGVAGRSAGENDPDPTFGLAADACAPDTAAACGVRDADDAGADAATGILDGSSSAA